MEWIDIKSGELPKENSHILLKLKVWEGNNKFGDKIVDGVFYNNQFQFDFGWTNGEWIGYEVWKYNDKWTTDDYDITHWAYITPPVINKEKE